MVDIFDISFQLNDLEDELRLTISRLIRERLEKANLETNLDFIGGNALDILIDTNIDVESIVNHAYIIPNDATPKEKRSLGLKKFLIENDYAKKMEDLQK